MPNQQEGANESESVVVVSESVGVVSPHDAANYTICKGVFDIAVTT